MSREEFIITTASEVHLIQKFLVCGLTFSRKKKLLYCAWETVFVSTVLSHCLISWWCIRTRGTRPFAGGPFSLGVLVSNDGRKRRCEIFCFRIRHLTYFFLLLMTSAQPPRLIFKKFNFSHFQLVILANRKNSHFISLIHNLALFSLAPIVKKFSESQYAKNF